MSTYCSSYSAASLAEYLEIIALLNDCMLNKHGASGSSQIYRMWYRGHEKQNYLLLPSLLRAHDGTGRHYGRDHLREDLRYQQFRSKCTQLIDTAPESKIEWQEVLQHHLGSTRLMDWSESAISALIFALEAFIDPKVDLELDSRRLNMTPAVWVLDPSGLNQHVYEALRANPDLIAAAARDLLPNATKTTPFCRKLTNQLFSGQDRYFRSGEGGTPDGIVCLSVIENERRVNAERLYNLLDNSEFNPFFYLLLRYYSDGLSVPMDTIPPLAIVHPYHSSRIQSQHGVFTVTPHYQIGKNQCNSIMDKRSMERQPLIRDCLYKINIARPAKVAKELLTIGERRAGIYPELDIYVRDIEVGKWRV